MSDDSFNVIVHHGGEVETHEEAVEVEIGDANGLNSDVEVEGEIEVETMPETVENAPTAETQTTQPPRNEVESQATSLPTPEEPFQQFKMKLQIRRRP
ncbi:hypothetical protein DEO72_LG7g2674 [Vigna unguiculata]|uniref:Uncharacterized protein n=1 Tax=Vigna unguiculata TaxID=3917 RepID=A0A4D6MN18_VIGUN|nr:hypothetical protein DEO72_LG7g2674 [Vigna unguiculata]